MTMGEKILNLRKARGWSQEELAERIGVTRQAVGRWESGAAKPDADKIIAVCDLFGVSADYLLRDHAAGLAATDGEAETERSKGFPLMDALRGMSVPQWISLGLITAGALILVILKINSGRHYVYGNFVRSYISLDDYLYDRQLYWLFFLGVGLAGTGLLRIILKKMSEFFLWNG